MELLSRNNFEGWMQKLMERLDRQDELLLAMKAEGKQPAITESIRLFDNQDLCMLLQISKRYADGYFIQLILDQISHFLSPELALVFTSTRYTTLLKKPHLH